MIPIPQMPFRDAVAVYVGMLIPFLAIQLWRNANSEFQTNIVLIVVVLSITCAIMAAPALIVLAVLYRFDTVRSHLGGFAALASVISTILVSCAAAAMFKIAWLPFLTNFVHMILTAALVSLFVDQSVKIHDRKERAMLRGFHA